MPFPRWALPVAVSAPADSQRFGTAEFATSSGEKTSPGQEGLFVERQGCTADMARALFAQNVWVALGSSCALLALYGAGRLQIEYWRFCCTHWNGLAHVRKKLCAACRMSEVHVSYPYPNCTWCPVSDNAAAVSFFPKYKVYSSNHV